MNHLPTPGSTRTDHAPAPDGADLDVDASVLTGEDGSLVAEYGLLAVVAATVAAVLITWARGDVLTSFFTQLLDAARNLVIP